MNEYSKFYDRQTEIHKDAELKKQLMAYYTPMPVVDFINRGVDDILKDLFGKEHGIASDGVQVLDFAMGSGIFLYDIIEKAFESGRDLDEVYELVQENFYGIEIDTESYDVAVNNLTDLFAIYGYEFDPRNLHNLNTLTEEGGKVACKR